MSQLFTLPKAVVFANSGRVLPGAKAFFYRSGTTTLQDIYQDNELTNPHTNPVIADAFGVLPPIYLNTRGPDYRVTVTDANDNPLPGYPVDPVPLTQGMAGGAVSASLLRLQASDFVFRFSPSGDPVPAAQQVIFRATLQNLAGPINWTTVPAGIVLSGVGETRALSVESFGNETSVLVRATANGQSDEITVYRLSQGGADAVVGLLTNESHTLPADAAGNVVSFASAQGDFRVFSGLTDVTDSATFSVVQATNCTGEINTATNSPVSGQPRGHYRITAMSADAAELRLQAVYGGLTIVKNFSIAKSRQGVQGTQGVQGVQGEPGQGAQFIRLAASAYVFAFDSGGANPAPANIVFTATRANLPSGATFSAVGNVSNPTLTGSGDSRTLSAAAFDTNDTVTVTATSGAFSDAITVVRLQDGANGSGINGVLTNESHTLAASPSGVVGSFAGADGRFEVFNGTLNVTGSSTFSVVSATGCTGTINTAVDTPVTGQPRGYYRVTAMSADQATLVLRAVFDGVTIDKTFSLSLSRTGATGAQGPQGTPGPQGVPGTQGLPGAIGARGAGSYQVGTGESGTGFSITAGDALVWASNVALTASQAQEAAYVIFARSSDNTLQPGDRLMMFEQGVRSGTRIYTGLARTIGAIGNVAGSDWSNPVTQIVDGSLIVNGTVGAQALAVNDLSAITANLGTVNAGILQNVSGSARFDLNNGRIVFSDGFVMSVIGGGFGVGNQFLEWYGPHLADISQCSDGNGFKWAKRNLQYKIGNQVFSPTLGANVVGTSLSATASVDTPVFSSVGQTIRVSLSYQFNAFDVVEFFPGTEPPPSSGTNQAVIDLFRSVNGGAFALVATLTANGFWSITSQTGFFVSVNYSSECSGSIVYDDPQQIVLPRQYRAVKRVSPDPTRFGNVNASQTITIVATES